VRAGQTGPPGADRNGEITLDTIRDLKLYQPKSGYRFSVDALLLSAFVAVPVAKRIADLGAGSGIIGMLLARKYSGSRVALLELQDTFVRLAEANVKQNHLEGRVSVVACDIRAVGKNGLTDPLLPKGSYDIVVSNPPFRRPKTGLVSPEEERAIARHEIRLRLPELIGAAQYLLRSKGKLFLIYHPERLAELILSLKEGNMEIKRLRFVHSSSGSEAKMVLVEALKDGRTGVKVERPLCLYDGEGGYSQEIRALCHSTPGESSL